MKEWKIAAVLCAKNCFIWHGAYLMPKSFKDGFAGF
jgi:hypothetical protein